MKSLMIVLLIIGGAYYYMTEVSGEKQTKGRGFVQQEKQAPKPKGVIPQHQLDAMKKARNVENVINQSVKDRDL